MQRSAIVGVDLHLLAGVAGPAERNEVVQVMRPAVSGGRDVVDLRPVGATAKDALVAVPFAGEPSLALPCADVGIGEAAAPQDRVLAGLREGLPGTVASPTAHHVLVAAVALEVGRADNALTDLTAGATPSGLPVAGPRASGDEKLRRGAVEGRAADLAWSRQSVPSTHVPFYHGRPAA
jgi:hypothetical protein